MRLTMGLAVLLSALGGCGSDGGGADASIDLAPEPMCNGHYAFLCGTDCGNIGPDSRCLKGQWHFGESCDFPAHYCETSYGRFYCDCNGSITCFGDAHNGPVECIDGGVPDL